MRFAAIFVPDFVVQAAMRCQPGNTHNRNQPVAILDGPDSLLRVLACNPAAQLAGVEIGVTKAQAEQCPGLVLLRRAIAQENAAQSALIECALAFSPLVESTTAGAVTFEITNQLEEGGDADESAVQEIYRQIDEIDQRILSIHRNRRLAYSDEMKASCGVVIGVGQDGEPAFVYGLLKKKDEKAAARTQAADAEISAAEPDAESEPESRAYSAALIESLTQHKTAALAAEVSQQPDIALAAVVHAMVLNEFGLDLQLYRSGTCVQVSTRQTYLDGANDSPAVALLGTQKHEWLQKLTGAKDELWPWCLRQDRQILLNLLAYCVARTVNAVKSKSDVDGQGKRCEQADALASALRFDMNKWFTPTAGNFFSRIPKSRIADALAEAGKPASAETLKLKKTELAALAETDIRKTGWLPEPVRIPRLNQFDSTAAGVSANE